MELEILNGMITGSYHNLFSHGPERASQESSFHVCGVTAGGQPCGYLWSEIPPETMSMSMIRATTGDHGDSRSGIHAVGGGRVDVWRFVLLRGTMLDPSSVMQPEAMWVPMFCAASGNHVESMI